MSVGCINMKGSACALGNVPKLNQQRTLMSAGYFRLQRRALPDSVKKVLQMKSVQQLGRIAAIQRIYHNIIFDLLHKFVLQIINLVGVSRANRSEEHTSELQSLMRISYAVFCLKKKNRT